jgi:hypothetical protein
MGNRHDAHLRALMAVWEAVTFDDLRFVTNSVKDRFRAVIHVDGRLTRDHPSRYLDDSVF